MEVRILPSPLYRKENDMTYEEFEKMFPGFDGFLLLYISGSQGVAPAELVVDYGADFDDLDSLCDCFTRFIDENALENIDSYIEDCENDEAEALMEAIIDSGDFLLGIDGDHLTHEYSLGFITKL